jgi:hypothetical protein
MNNLTRDNTPKVNAGELHLHPVGVDEWIGVVYFDGIKQGEIGPMPSLDAAKREAAERFKAGLKPFVWSQDGGIIVSED